MILNMEGIPIRTTLDHDKTVQYSALITQLTAKAKSVVRDLDPQVEHSAAITNKKKSLMTLILFPILNL